MEREQAGHEQDAQQAPKGQSRDDGGAATAVTNHKPGGKDALGTKENLLSPYYDEMVEVAKELAPQFTPLGLHFRPEILLATAMQEAANKDPLNARSFDNGLGIMQITPYKGKLDPGVAKAIGWDNSKSVEYNVQHAKWRDAKANLAAGAQTMLGKARAIKNGVSKTWEQMDEPHRWRAVLFGYNAGEGSAIAALRAGGPNATMISSFTYKGKRVSHDYTAEIKAKMDYVDGHDPFGGGGAGGGDDDGKRDVKPDTKSDDKPDKQEPDKLPAAHGIKKSVGRGGVNLSGDVRAVQTRLEDRGVESGKIDGLIGPNTIHAIEAFQDGFLPNPDGLISPDHITEKHLFGESKKIATKPGKGKGEGKGKQEPALDSKDKADTKDEPLDQQTDSKETKHPSYEAISKNFSATIPGSQITWHQALYLPSWGRHAKPSDVTNTSMDVVIANIEKQAAALQKVSDHFGKPIVVHCWLRPPAYNKQIGGASNSAHLRGMATDFHMAGISAEQVRKELKAHPKLYPGSGENNVSWVHIDLEHRAWFNP
jgi:peptidoglycan hydrolase-like protein with peptidoglycan-binding domain